MLREKEDLLYFFFLSHQYSIYEIFLCMVWWELPTIRDTIIRIMWSVSKEKIFHKRIEVSLFRWEWYWLFFMSLFVLLRDFFFFFFFFPVLSDVLEQSFTFLFRQKISVRSLLIQERKTDVLLSCRNLFSLFNLRFPFPGERNRSRSLPRSIRVFVDSFTWLRYKKKEVREEKENDR